MEIKFDKEKCLKLLKEKKILEKEGKFLRDYDKTKYDELSGYLNLLDNQIFWQSRQEYIQILDLFVQKKITLDEFVGQFFRLRGSNLNSVKIYRDKLEEINIQFNPKSCEFTRLISSHLYSLVEMCDPDVTLEFNLKYPQSIYYVISEEYMRLTIKKYFLPKLKNFQYFFTILNFYI